MSNNKRIEKEPFEDLSGPGAPIKRETESQYYSRRAKEEEESRQVFLKEGIRGGLIFTAATTAFVVGGSLISPRFYKTLNWANRTFIISSGFVAGFWIYGETASRQVIHNRLYSEMDQFYNGPQPTDKKK